MFFEETFVFAICFIIISIFALLMFLDNGRLMLKNGKLRKENKKLKITVAAYEEQKLKDKERLRPYFDYEKDHTVNPRAEEKKRKDSLAAIASAMSMFSQKNIKNNPSGCRLRDRKNDGF